MAAFFLQPVRIPNTERPVGIQHQPELAPEINLFHLVKGRQL